MLKLLTIERANAYPQECVIAGGAVLSDMKSYGKADPVQCAILDQRLLANLKEIAGDSYDVMIRQLFELYLENAPKVCAELQCAISDRDFVRINQAAHALKSMSMNIGSKVVSDQCQYIEDSARSRKPFDYITLSDDLLYSVNEVEAYIENLEPSGIRF